MKRINQQKPYVLRFGGQFTESDKYLAWCERHPDGYVANGKVPEGLVVIHGADCAWARGDSWGDPTMTNIKLTSVDQNLLMATVGRIWTDAPIIYCGHCFE